MVYRHPLIIHSAPFGRCRYQLWDFSFSTFVKPHQTTGLIRILSHPDDPPGARIAWRPAPWAWVLREKKQWTEKRVLGPTKPMKNKGFGHLKTRSFTIKTSKNVGLGGPWYTIRPWKSTTIKKRWCFLLDDDKSLLKSMVVRKPTYEKWWLVGLPGKGLKSYPS